MQPGEGDDRKRPSANDPSDQGGRRRRRGDGASSSPRLSGDYSEERLMTGRADDVELGFQGQTSITAELERQLREQMLFNELLQSRRNDPSLGLATRYEPMFAPSTHNQGVATRHEPMFAPSSHSFRQTQPPDRLQYNEERARQASGRPMGLEFIRPDQVGRLGDRRQLPDSPRQALLTAESLSHHQLMLQQAIRQHQLSRHLQEPLTDLERFSRGLGDYAMAHHHRIRDLSAPSRISSIPQLSLGESPYQRHRPSIEDMRSAHRLGSIGVGNFVQDEQKSTETRTSGIPMELSSDVEQLTIYQVLIRRSLEYFVAKETDVATSVRGRKQKIRIGQIGVRCKYCAHMPLRQRNKGAVYYAKSLINVYQAAQNIATAHFATESACPYMPVAIREEIAVQRPRRDASKAGRSYWVEACQSIGIVERDDALWFDIRSEAGESQSQGGQPMGKSETL